VQHPQVHQKSPEELAAVLAEALQPAWRFEVVGQSLVLQAANKAALDEITQKSMSVYHKLADLKRRRDWDEL
jgi:hypothetical protein